MRRQKKAHKKIKYMEVENEKDKDENEDNEDDREEKKHTERENKAMQKQMKNTSVSDIFILLKSSLMEK